MTIYLVGLGYSLVTLLHELGFSFKYIYVMCILLNNSDILYINLIKTLGMYWPSS